MIAAFSGRYVTHYAAGTYRALPFAAFFRRSFI